MAVTKSFRVGTARTGTLTGTDDAGVANVGKSFNYTILDTSVFCFSNRYDTIEGVLLNVWAPYLIIADATMSSILKQSKNTQYVSPTTVNLNSGLDGTTITGSAVVLNDTNVQLDDCIIQFNWTDSSVSTALSQGRFYGYDKVNIANAPTNTTVVAFERTDTAVRKNRISNDSAGKAWDAAYGVGGRGNALSLADQASASTHTYYIGFSARPNSYGSSNLGLILEFDVS